MRLIRFKPVSVSARGADYTPVCLPVARGGEMCDPDEVARMCSERYTALPRRGKPEEGREWTQLAAVIQVTRCPDTHTGGCTRGFWFHRQH